MLSRFYLLLLALDFVLCMSQKADLVVYFPNKSGLIFLAEA